jgi:outer membrane receptor protein involved in Fe transport
MKIYTIILLILLLPIFALAQEKSKEVKKRKSINLTEVIIKAEKAESKLQETPVSATLLTIDKIENENINTLSDISTRVPNFFILDYGSKLSPPVFMRGMGLRRDASPSVGLYVDNIPYLEKGSFNFDFVDIQSIEILRGPQGTLYGRNTMGGLIKIYTQNPKANFSAYVKSEYGNHNTSKTVLRVNQPISKKFYTVFNAGYSHGDGFYYNVFSGKKADSYDTYSIRIKAAYRLNNKFKAILSAGFERNNQLANPYAKYDIKTQTTKSVNYNKENSYHRDLLSIGLNVEYKGKNTILSFSTSYQYLDDKLILDQDFSPLDFFFMNQKRVHHTFYNELNLHSTKQSKIKYLVGMMYFRATTDKSVNVFYEKDYPIRAHREYNSNSYTKKYKQPTIGFAMYGQSTLPLGKINITGGVRIEYESADLAFSALSTTGETEISQPGYNSDLNFHQVLPKLTISYLPCKHFTIFGAITKGFKTGGFNTSFVSKNEKSYNPEKSTNFELGIKSSWLNDRLTANLSYFSTNINDQQVNQLLPSGQGVFTDNAAKSRSWGLEMEVNGYLKDNWQIWSSFGYNKVRFLNYTNSKNVDLSNKFAPFVPRYTFSIGTNYSINFQNLSVKKIQINLNYQHIGKIFWNEENTATQNSYGLANSKISFETRVLIFGVWAKNLFDIDYKVLYFATRSSSFVQLGKPAQFGIFAKIKF